MSEILNLGAFELAEKIKSKELSSQQVTEAHINQIKKVNPKLNAVVEENFEVAMIEAEQKDKHPSDKPLWGVPCTIKEMISIEGFRHTLGSIHRKSNVQQETATVVTRLTEAGAIVMGTTNVPEIGLWFECSNKVYGTTNNPYDVTRTPGGSSGGEGTIIGAGASPFGIGSDIGGSIRMPAAFCGIFGHKPSSKLIPMTGHVPVYRDNANIWAGNEYPPTVLGPMARKATDLYPLTELLMGTDGFDPETRDTKLKSKITNWKNITVYTIASPHIKLTSESEHSLIQAVAQSANYFKNCGAAIKEVPEKVFYNATEIWFARMSLMTNRSFHQTLNPDGKISYLQQMAKAAFNKADYTLPSLIAGVLDKIAVHNPVTEKKRIAALAELEVMKKDLTIMLGENAILLMPPHPRLAPKHHSPLFHPFDWTYTGIINALEFPATVAPVAMADGLPVAVQIVSGPLNDHLTMSAAEALETAFGGWRMPLLN